MVVLLDEVNPEAAANSKKLSAYRPVKFATYPKDIQKPGVFLKLLGFNPKVLLRNQVFAERQ
jgi:ABC-type Fe3+ transport system substrate-binding protein